MSHRRGYCMPMGHATTLLLASHSRTEATYVPTAPPRETCASDTRYGAQVLNRPSLPIPLPWPDENTGVRFIQYLLRLRMLADVERTR